MKRLIVEDLDLGYTSGNKLVMFEHADFLSCTPIIVAEQPINTKPVEDSKKKYCFPNSYLLCTFKDTQIVLYWDGFTVFEIASIRSNKVTSKGITLTGVRRQSSHFFTSAFNTEEFYTAVKGLKLKNIKPLSETIDMSSIDMSLIPL